MDKNAIRKFATEARRDLISRVSQRAVKFGVTDQGFGDPDALAVNGHMLSPTEKKQRAGLIKEVKEKGYEQVIEEVAYTWFNRFIALRFMEANGYLPSRVRVFTDEANNFKPQILAEAIHLSMRGLDKEKVYAYKEANDDEGLYKYLLITQCNALYEILPGMFQEISDYTELLFPDKLLSQGSTISQMIDLISEEDWRDSVQIIGWLYQYYISEKKDDVFAAIKGQAKITKENIPAATQLFTPDWIVRYMVENSLGRLWQEGHPDEDMKAQWKYYLEEADQEPEVQVELEKNRQDYKNLRPEEIKCIDPCSGSGHILVYIFDLLMEIYQSQGYNSRAAVASIVKNNIYGLDLDDRASQLSYFSVMMKARQYDRGFFGRNIHPNVYSTIESNNIDMKSVEYFCQDDEKIKTAIHTIIEELHDAKEYGSIIRVSDQDWEAIYNHFDEIFDDSRGEAHVARMQLLPLVEVAQVMAQKYHMVVTNPPYMGRKNMNAKLAEYVRKNYPDSKNDLCTVFIERGNEMLVENGVNCMVTMQSWMFLSSFEKMRKNILKTKTITNLMHMENMVLGIAFGTSATFFRNHKISNYKGTYNHIKYSDIVDDAPKEFPVIGNRFAQVSEDNFTKIPGSPVAYWVSDSLFSAFEVAPPMGKLADIKVGLQTGNNGLFLKLWYEINYLKIAFDSEDGHNVKYVPHNKAGAFRKWYGNMDYVVNWSNDGKKIKTCKGSRPQNISYYFKSGYSWSDVSSGALGCRFWPSGSIFDTCAPTIFPKTESKYLFGLVNSRIGQYIMNILSPTIHYTAGSMMKIPVLGEQDVRVDEICCENIDISKQDWDSFETSWDFKRHPLVREVSTISEGFNQWKQECEDRFLQLKSNEEELNRIFIDIYDLQSELTPEVEDKDITVSRVFDTKEDVPESMIGSRYVRTKEDEVISFISYAVGCMFGRYSLDVDGLAYAGGDWDESKYKTFKADRDNIIPICDDDYFADDIVGRFVKFVEVVYGEDTLDKNLEFIADALGGKGQAKEVIRNYFLKDFYKDHCKLYQKRPIYWLFDSGKKNGFKCLVYMHRYQADLLARIRTDYVHEQQSRYRTAILDLQNRMDSASTSEAVKLKNKLKKLEDQDKEVLTYEEKIHHLADQMIDIDLDDGVVNNYAIFEDVLAKIK